MSTLLVLGALLAFARQGGDFARLQALALEPGRNADDVALADLDGDGTAEVLLAISEEEREFGRHLETWRRQESGTLARVASLALTRDVVAFAHADVLAGGGDELLLFNAGGVFALPSGPEARPVRLMDAEFLWQAADPRGAFHWEHGVVDLDGDGLADLVVPEPDGFVVAVQRRAEDPGAPFGLVSRVRVPREPADDDERMRERRRDRSGASSEDGSFKLDLDASDEDEEDTGTLVSVDERVPSPAWLDWDADGDLDLLLQTRATLHVWLQDAGRFAEAPQLSLALPVVADRTRELDASYSAHAVDLDRDRRADYAVFAGDKASDDVRAQGLFFSQAAAGEGPPLFGAEGRPASLLVFAGFLSDPAFRDLDGDGYPELIVRTVRPDLIDQIRSAASETIDVEMFVYKNRAGTLARRPDLARRFALALDEGELEVEFLGDLTGDGLSELFVRDGPETVRVLMLRAQGGRESAWSLVDKPLWELRVAKGARVEAVTAGPGRRPGVFVLEPAQVLWVSFQ